MHPTANENMALLDNLYALLKRTYELVKYAESKFDSAAPPANFAGSRNHPGHVEKDSQFLDSLKELKEDITELVESSWDPFEPERFRERLEKTSFTVPAGQYAKWKGEPRCPCWWDEKDKLQEVAHYLDERIKEVKSWPATRDTVREHNNLASVPPPEFPFVDPVRTAELRSITSKRYDLSRLIQICEELNRSYANECYLAVAMLTRAVLDHVPPIFGLKKFSEVASNYGGSKSFRDSMQHLENSSRKIADAHLHTPIRVKEVLPNRTQINFSNDLDVLLAEIVRILR